MVVMRSATEQRPEASPPSEELYYQQPRWFIFAIVAVGGSMRGTSGVVGRVIGTLAVFALLPLSAEADQVGNVVNSAKDVATKVVPLAKKAAPVASKAVQTVRGNGSAPATAPQQAQAAPSSPAQPQANPSLQDQAVGVLRSAAAGVKTPAASPPAPAPSPAPRGAPPGAPPG